MHKMFKMDARILHATLIHVILAENNIYASKTYFYKLRHVACLAFEVPSIYMRIDASPTLYFFFSYSITKMGFSIYLNIEIEIVSV